MDHAGRVLIYVTQTPQCAGQCKVYSKVQNLIYIYMWRIYSQNFQHEICTEKVKVISRSLKWYGDCKMEAEGPRGINNYIMHWNLQRGIMYAM